MKKNILISSLVVLLLSSLFVFAGCNKTQTFINDFTKNMEEVKTASSNISVFDKAVFETDITEFHNGLCLIENTDETKTVYSCLAKETIVTVQKDETVEFKDLAFMSYAIVLKTVTGTDGKTTNTFKIFDTNGLVCFEDNNYTINSLNIEQLEEDENTIIETISYKNASRDAVELTYALNKYTGIRSKVNVSDSSTYIEYLSDEEDLAALLGLDKYIVLYMSSRSQDSYYLSVYKKSNNKLVNTVSLDTSDKEILFMCSGKIYYSVTTLLNKDAKDYDYLVDNSENSDSYENAFLKYKYNVYSLDVLNGKIKEVKIDYVIESADMDDAITLNGKNNAIEYVPATIRKINKNKQLEPVESVVLDAKQNIVFSSNFINVASLQKLSKDRYIADPLNSYSGIKLLLDKNFNILCEVFNPIVDVENKIIYCKLNGKYGAIDYDMNIVTKFEYDSCLSNKIIDGNLVVSKNSETYILKNGKIDRVTSDIEKFDTVYHLLVTINTETTKTTYKTLTGDEVLTVDSVDPYEIESRGFTVLEKFYRCYVYLADGKINIVTTVES